MDAAGVKLLLSASVGFLAEGAAGAGLAVVSMVGERVAAASGGGGGDHAGGVGGIPNGLAPPAGGIPNGDLRTHRRSAQGTTPSGTPFAHSQGAPHGTNNSLGAWCAPAGGRHRHALLRHHRLEHLVHGRLLCAAPQSSRALSVQRGAASAEKPTFTRAVFVVGGVCTLSPPSPQER